MAKADSTRARLAALGIVRQLHDQGHVAYFAGGCVRDELLGLEPTDYDVATDARPQRVTELFDRTAEVGASFGVVLVRTGGATIEVATFRADGPYTDSRRPDAVTFADPRSDAHRRDFTINALFLDPLAAEDAPSIHGHVIDYVGGMADVSARIVRAVGDPGARLREDHLRALRAVRLASRLGFEIEAETGAAIARDARALVGVSRERIGDEIRRMMAHRSRAVAIARLEQLGLDGPVLGNARGSDGALDTLEAMAPDAPVPTSLGAWAIDRGLALEPEAIGVLVNAWRSALCLSNEARDDMLGALTILARLREWPSLGVASRKRIGASRGFDQALLLLKATDPGAHGVVERDLAELGASHGGLAPAPLLRGEDLIAHGLKPGPDFGRILDSVYDAQLEGRVVDRSEAMELARSLYV
jgi:hypothetical protein